MAVQVKTNRLSTEIIEDLESVRDHFMEGNYARASYIIGEAQDKIDTLTDEVNDLRRKLAM